MKEFSLRPEIYSFPTFEDFAKEYEINKTDVILTNEYIYEPFMKKLNLNCTFIFQEKYGTGEPTDIMVDQILNLIHQSECKRVIAIGGGTIIDIAKILVLKGAENVDILYNQETLVKDKTLVIIPTTCGTGSEVTNLSIINRTRKGTKMGLGSPAMYADAAVLIPDFLSSLPYYVFATSSIDALIHATESYLSPNSTRFTEIFSIAAIKSIISGYCRIAAGGEEVRFLDSEEYLRASTYAGIAFGNAGCAAVHAMSYALGAKYHVPHGESNYQFFTDILQLYHQKKPEGKILQLENLLAKTIQEGAFTGTNKENGISLLEELLEKILTRKDMREYGAIEADVLEFAKSTIENQQRLLKNNYVSLSLEEIEEIYQARL